VVVEILLYFKGARHEGAEPGEKANTWSFRKTLNVLQSKCERLKSEKHFRAGGQWTEAGSQNFSVEKYL
jgi:hypothetical protein